MGLAKRFFMSSHEGADFRVARFAEIHSQVVSPEKMGQGLVRSKVGRVDIMTGGASQIAVLVKGHIFRDDGFLRPYIIRMQVTFQKYFFVAIPAERRYGGSHVASRDVPGRVHHMTGGAFRLPELMRFLQYSLYHH